MFAITAAVTVLADGDDWHGHMDWGGAWWMLFPALAITVPLIAIAVWLVRTTAAGPPSPPGGDHPTSSALRILGERYARGEISTDEYRERSGELQ